MIRFILNLYSFIIIADVLLSWAPQYQKEEWAKIIKRLAGYTLNPVREILPKDLPFDISPIIVLLILRLIPSLW